MATLKEQLDKVEEAAGISKAKYKTNEKVEAKLNEFIKNNPAVVEYVKGMDRERLERAALLGYMAKAQQRERVSIAVRQWSSMNPGMSEKFLNTIKSNNLLHQSETTKQNNNYSTIKM